MRPPTRHPAPDTSHCAHVVPRYHDHGKDTYIGEGLIRTCTHTHAHTHAHTHTHTHTRTCTCTHAHARTTRRYNTKDDYTGEGLEKPNGILKPKGFVFEGTAE